MNNIVISSCGQSAAIRISQAQVTGSGGPGPSRGPRRENTM